MDTVISGTEGAVETNWADSIETHEPHVKTEETIETTPEVVEEPPKEVETQEKPKKKPTGYLKKLGRAEAERDMERSQRLALESRIAQLEGKTSGAEAKKSDELTPPNADDFSSYYELQQAEREYDRKMLKKEAEETVTKALTARETEAQDRAFAAELDKKADAFDSKLAKENPELLEKITDAASEGLINKPIAFHIINSENSVEVADYLTSNPDKLAAMSRMNQGQLAIAMARIEGIVEASGKSSVTQDRVTKASAPISSIKKTGSATKSYTDMSLSELDKHWKK